ncbi:hypothetical protein AK88_01032 [Plasmodium fragile]|uniref:Uncharacterized protein n=1 Tax=Plasmodium fragile TaxID=5857 RepID=A0A0D9QTW5_PLAFR|nr:uncharacterized protein AK88_01032 [Plasmodium fragile]KJP89366.1 hypothetical protein AK88_01032 [Plasmodium fragile]
MSDVPQEEEESTKVAAAEGEVTEEGGSDAGNVNSEGWHSEERAEDAAREAKKVRKSLSKAGKAAKGESQKKKAKKKAKKKDKEVTKKKAKKAAKNVAAKEAKAMGKRKKGESSPMDDTSLTESEDELYNDDNLFMPKALKKKAHKKSNKKSKTNDQKGKQMTNQISKTNHEKSKKKKKNKMKSKFCTAECLPLDHYEEAREKELASYATSGFKKYLVFLKNYKTTVGVEDTVVSKKPRHMYV